MGGSTLSSSSEQQEFSARLRALSGDPFQSAIFVALTATFPDVQAVSKRPSGDGGVDILTENLTAAHCCYGIEPDTISTNRKPVIRRYVVDKFAVDLKRILELDGKPKKYKHSENPQLKGILGTGRKIKLIRLVCNYFEDNQIIGKLNDAFVEMMSKSKKNFVTDACALVFLGPDQIAALCVIDQSVLVRVTYPDLAKLKEVLDPKVVLLPSTQSDFDGKFDALIAKKPEKAGAINKLRESFRSEWNHALLLMQKLESDYPNVHKALETIAESCAKRANLESVNGTNLEAASLVQRYQDLMREMITKELSNQLPSDLITTIAEYHTAKLIGDCPIDWR